MNGPLAALGAARMGSMRSRICWIVAAGLLLAACQTTKHYEQPLPVPPPPPPPPVNEFAWSVKPGRNAIDGLAVWTRDGKRFSCAGQSVALMPETPYTRNRMVELYGSDEQAIRTVAEVRAHATPQTRDIKAYVRPAQCDNLGAFSYQGLPDGAWFVIVRASSASGDEVVALRRVRVSGGATSAVRVGM
jgi:hypothetical protein